MHGPVFQMLGQVRSSDCFHVNLYTEQTERVHSGDETNTAPHFCNCTARGVTAQVCARQVGGCFPTKQRVLEQMSLRSTPPMMQAAGIAENLLVTQS